MADNVISNDSQENKSSLEQEIDELQIAFEVRETRFSRCPTSNRQTVVDILHSLSQKCITALKDDCLENRRYATHAKLINQIGTDKLTGQPKIEELEIRPPPSASTFNDIEASDLEYTLCKKILEIDDSYRWHNVRMCFDYFINEQAKQIIDRLNEEDAFPGSNFLTSTHSNVPSNSGDPQPSTSKTQPPKEPCAGPSKSVQAPKLTTTPKNKPSSSKSNGGSTTLTPAIARVPQPANGLTPLPTLTGKRTSEAILSGKRPPKPPPRPPTTDDDDSDCEIVFETTKTK